MSVETLSAPMGAAGGAVGSSISAPSFSPGLEAGLSGGSRIRGQSLSGIMAGPELKVGPSFDTRMVDTITVIPRPAIFASPAGGTPKTEVAPVTREVFAQPSQVKIPDLWVTPPQKRDYGKNPTPKPKTESFAVSTISASQDVVKDVQSVNEIIDSRQKAAEFSVAVQPQAKIESVPHLIGQSREDKTVEPGHETGTITAQEQEADKKLAKELMVQIEASPNLTPEQKTGLINRVEIIVEAKTQGNEVSEGETVTQAHTQPESLVQTLQTEEPWWEINKVEKQVIVDEEKDQALVQTEIKYEGKIPQRKLEPEARKLADDGAKVLLYDNRYGWREGAENSYRVEDLDKLDQKAA